MMFALRFDGFIQPYPYKTLEEAKIAYAKAVRNTLLYEYDCAVVELNDDGTEKRRVSFEELNG